MRFAPVGFSVSADWQCRCCKQLNDPLSAKCIRCKTPAPA